MLRYVLNLPFLHWAQEYTSPALQSYRDCPEIPSLLGIWDAPGCLPQQENKPQECGRAKPSGCSCPLSHRFSGSLRALRGLPRPSADRKRLISSQRCPDVCPRQCRLHWRVQGGSLQPSSVPSELVQSQVPSTVVNIQPVFAFIHDHLKL